MSRAALLIATRNAHKAREIRQVLTGDFQFLTLHDFPAAPDVVEDGATFAANASKKAASLAVWLVKNGPAASLPSSNSSNLSPNLSTLAPFYVLADDSGLEVDDLGGSPGVHSARFAALDTGLAGNSPDAANNAKLLRLLAKAPLPRRAARFRCVLALKKLPETWMAGRAVHCPPSGIVGGTSAAPLSRGGQSRLVGSPTARGNSSFMYRNRA
jgi:XTP/dITP diphosphohydrolase